MSYCQPLMNYAGDYKCLKNYVLRFICSEQENVSKDNKRVISLFTQLVYDTNLQNMNEEISNVR